MTLSCIGIDDSLIQPNGMAVRAFDGTKTSACREFDLKVFTGPYGFKISFVVVHTDSKYSKYLQFALGTAALAGAISSSLHERIKYISSNKLITGMAKKDILMPTSTMVPFIDTQHIYSASKYSLLMSYLRITYRRVGF